MSAQRAIRPFPSSTTLFSLGFTGLTIVSYLSLALTFLWMGRGVLFEPGLTSFLFGRDWFYRSREFGAASMLFASILVPVVALTLAVPIGLGTAIFISEWLPRSGRLVVKSLVELLAGVPSVIYGILGVLLLRDWVYRWLAPFEPLSGDTLATAAILLAVMILPTVTTLSEDALQGVPSQQRTAARTLGLTRSETLTRVVLPQARSGLMAAVLIGLGRAAGETIAIYLVVGRLDGQLSSSIGSLAQPGQTLSTKLGGPELFLAASEPEHWSAVMALGALLLAGTTLVTVLGRGLASSARDHA